MKCRATTAKTETEGFLVKRLGNLLKFQLVWTCLLVLVAITCAFTPSQQELFNPTDEFKSPHCSHAPHLLN